jgi:negative regulator of flagellin synthesis FlgM
VASAINGFSGSGTTSVGTSRPTRQSARDTSVAATAPTPSEGADEVRISGTASQLASLGQKLSALPAIDAARVARTSQSLADGTYRISADKIASGLLQSDHALAQIGMYE